MFDADQRLRRFLASAPDPTLVVDKSGVILFASDQVEPVFGYEPAQLLGAQVEMLMPERFRKGHGSLFGAYVSQPTRRPMGAGLDLYAEKKDGREFPVEISLSPVADGSSGYVICAIRDVSDRRKMEVALRATAARLDAAKSEAERATAVKSRFLAAASHDLRQPLQAATLYLSLLAKQASGPQQETCAKMRRPLQVMAGILDALLDNSMLDSGMVTPNRSNFALKPLLDRVAGNLAPIAEEKNLKLHYPGTDLIVNSDPALLERILENLVSNAVRYTNDGGVTIAVERDGDIARVSVVDTGIGIPREALERIFDEYFQYDNPSRNIKKGLGLGLAIVRRLADLLRHHIFVDSVFGQGSTFTLELRCAELGPKDEIPAAARASEEKERDVAVLFVDDDPAVLDSLTMFLAATHVRSRGAASGNQAVAAVAEGFRPNVLISDYRLPNENGLLVVGRVRDALGFDIPAIVMSGDTSLRQIEAQNIPKVLVVQKPIDPEALVDLIYKHAASA
jgi:PAS domain S-box-containing protein